MSFAQQQMQFGRVLAGLNQPSQGALLEVRLTRLARGNSQHVKIVQLVRRLCPQRFEHARGVGVSLGEKVAQAQKVARLVRIRRVVHHGFEGRDGGAKIVLPVIDQAHVETNARHLWHQTFSFAQHFQGLRPLLAPHGDDPEVGIGASSLRIQSQHTTKGTLGQVEVVFLQGGLALLK